MWTYRIIDGWKKIKKKKQMLKPRRTSSGTYSTAARTPRGRTQPVKYHPSPSRHRHVSRAVLYIMMARPNCNELYGHEKFERRPPFHLFRRRRDQKIPFGQRQKRRPTILHAHYPHLTRLRIQILFEWNVLINRSERAA